jgi:phosphoglycerate dehydrogenase-like enzyme
MNNDTAPLTVFITSPLEPEHVERIRAVAPGRVEVVYEPDLLPPTRYVADHKGREDFRRTPEQEARWRANLKRADALWDFPVPPEDGTPVAELLPRLKWVQTTSSGVGQLVTRLGLQDSDILVTTASGIHCEPLTEYVFMALLVHLKDLDRLRREQAAHRWERYCGEELAGKTLGILGAGRVGRAVAAAARFFDMRVIATDVQFTDSQSADPALDRQLPVEQLHTMLSEADVLVLCVPHTPETERMIDAAAFAAMKDGVVLVNIARGQVVDENELIAALRSGKVGFAALDVFETEPLPIDSPLWDMPNVLVTPHSASTVPSENRKITDFFCHNLRCFLEARTGDMRNVLDKEKMF